MKDLYPHTRFAGLRGDGLHFANRRSDAILVGGVPSATVVLLWSALDDSPNAERWLILGCLAGFLVAAINIATLHHEVVLDPETQRWRRTAGRLWSLRSSGGSFGELAELRVDFWPPLARSRWLERHRIRLVWLNGDAVVVGHHRTKAACQEDLARVLAAVRLPVHDESERST